MSPTEQHRGSAAVRARWRKKPWRKVGGRVVHSALVRTEPLKHNSGVHVLFDCDLDHGYWINLEVVERLGLNCMGQAVTCKRCLAR